MIRACRGLVLFFLCAALSGCGYLFGDSGFFRDKSEDYRKARELAVIDVPPGLDGSALQEIYAIPPVQDSITVAGKFEVPRPSPLASGADSELVRIQRLGDDSWALVAVAPGQLWPQVRSFLSAAGVQVTRADARLGIIESDWLQMKDQTGSSRFRFRIERGVQRGTSELHVLHKGMVGDSDTWPASSDDFAQESEMLRAVAQYVANSADTAPVSMMADQAISSGGKISLKEEAGRTYISLGLPFSRAWASVALALEESTFEITDRDRSAGNYYVRFLGPDSEEKGGWFDWLTGGDDKHPLAGRNLIFQVTADGEEAVRIALLPEADQEPIALRDEQALLDLVKGNID